MVYQNVVVLKDPHDYFPYIAHSLNHDFVSKGKLFNHANRGIIEFLMGDLFLPSNRIDTSDAALEYQSTKGALFSRIKIEGINIYKKLIQEENAVIIACPRHKSMIDYMVLQPVHYNFIKRDFIIAAGDNLFISGFRKILRNFGAFMFLRDDKKFKLEEDQFERLKVDHNSIKYFIDKKGQKICAENLEEENQKQLEKLIVDKKLSLLLERKFFNLQVLGAYLKQELIEKHHDLGLFAEYESNGEKIDGGRTKTGQLRNLASIVFRLINRESGSTKVYLAPINFSAAKYPDAYIVSNKELENRGKIKYAIDLNYIFNIYPHFAEDNVEAKIQGTIQYGAPILLNNFKDKEISTIATPKLKRGIGLLETPYPASLLFRCMDQDTDISFKTLDERISRIIDKYQKLGVDTSEVGDKQQNALRAETLANLAKETLNSNPVLFTHKKKSSHQFLVIKNNRVCSQNYKLQQWYGNLLRHLDNPK